MKTIDSEHACIIPVDFYNFYLEACKYKKIKYSKIQTLSETTFEIINEMICQKDEERFLGIDMLNIGSYPLHLFTKIYDGDGKVFFYNIKEENLKLRMKEDIPSLHWVNDEVACFDDAQHQNVEDLLQGECIDVKHRNVVRIVNEIMVEQGMKPYRLDSSNMYSSCYMSAKKLFVEIEEFYFIIFSMAELVYQCKNVDALVTSSKNGAVIAAILSDLLKIKEVHLLGVGPKYSMELGDSVDCIKEGKRYVYIFDFMCTGTELKIVSALINSKKAILQDAVGISRYQEDIGLKIRGSIKVLAEAEELKDLYIIAGKEEDVIKLKEVNENG